MEYIEVDSIRDAEKIVDHAKAAMKEVHPHVVAAYVWQRIYASKAAAYYEAEEIQHKGASFAHVRYDLGLKYPSLAIICDKQGFPFHYVSIREGIEKVERFLDAL